MNNPIPQLTALGQSLWYDNIQRRLLAKSPQGENGELAAMIQNGDIRGVTSNPTIFHNAISKTSDYDSALLPLALAGWDAESIFWQLAVEDIREACDLFKPLYEQTDGVDGYVSLEVSPYLANDTDGTVAQAKKLWETVKRPNLMIKIPATLAGIPAVRQVIAAGINVNVTLIFSLERYQAVMDAYLSGLEDCLLAGGDIERIHSVASFFVSRVDSKIDPKLPEGSPLRGKAAIANAKLAYDEFRKVFGGPRYGKLLLAKANTQRPLWASTGTKNPAYPDTIYVDNLIGPATVNTVPPQTLDAFRDHGKASQTIMEGLDECKSQIAELEALGIAMSVVTAELEEEGVKSFADAFTALLDSLEARRGAVAGQIAPLLPSVKQAVEKLEKLSAAQRMWALDPTLWTNDPVGQAEIKIRLGWLKLPETTRAALDDLNGFTASVREAGIKKVLLLGMGGSSLGPEVFSLVFDTRPEVCAFAILDSTDPGQVAATAAQFPPVESIYLVASKSGGTAEVTAMFDYFWMLSEKEFGAQAGSRFVAITDPGTSLEKLARERGFRKIFNADPTVGGRYSALTHFGMLPSALMDINVERALSRAAWMMSQCAADVPAARNPGLVLGALMGQAALEGRDKLTILADDVLASVGGWLEQLIAESSGKEGKGIVVVDGEPHYTPDSYGNDRLFVYLRLDGQYDEFVTALRAAGQPVLSLPLAGRYDLFAEIYRWEIATAMACVLLEVNPFDQPNVQDAKIRAKAKIAEYLANGKFGAGEFVALDAAAEALSGFLGKAGVGDYVAINAYLPRNPELAALLTQVRVAVTARTGVPTTLGFGPRFLHSTGQLHKGGANNGLFLEITADPEADFDIPGQGLTFGTLERGQSMGDYEALQANGRRALRVHLPNPMAVVKLIEMI